MKLTISSYRTRPRYVTCLIGPEGVTTPQTAVEMLTVEALRKQPHKLKPAFKRLNLPSAPQLPDVLTLETELYRTVRLLLLLSQIFLCAPSGAHRQHDAGTRSERLLLFLHVGWCFAIYASFATCVYAEYTLSNVNLPTVQKPLFICEYLFYLVHILQIIAATYYGRHKFRRFLSTVVQFDHTLLTCGIKPDYAALAQFVRIHVLLVLSHILCTATVDYYYKKGVLVNYARSTTVYVLPNVILHVSLVQYYALLYAISGRSVHLNALLRTALSPRTDVHTLHAKLHKIRLLYAHIQRYTRSVNEAFAPSMVLVYVGSFINLTVNIFLLYKYMDEPSDADLAWILYSVAWAAMHIAKMFLILYYNYRVQNQKNATALLLNDIKGQNAEMEETVTHFILQLIINTRTNVVCGVAELNMDFIASLLVAISTLFIFLLQYDTTYEALTTTHKSAPTNRTNKTILAP